MTQIYLFLVSVKVYGMDVRNNQIKKVKRFFCESNFVGYYSFNYCVTINYGKFIKIT